MMQMTSGHFFHNTSAIKSQNLNKRMNSKYNMVLTQGQTKTPEWTVHEEQICAKILNEIRTGKVKLYQLR